MWEVKDAPGQLLQRFSVESYDLLAAIAMTLWGIWFFQKKKVWDNKVVTTQFTMDWSNRQLEDWKVAKSKSKGIQPTYREGRRTTQTKWEAPTSGDFKLNVDASVVQGDSFFTVGMVISDHIGSFIEGNVMRIGWETSVLEAEAVGILETD